MNDKIRKANHTDLEMILHWRNHEKVRSFMFTQHLIALEDHRRWFDKAVEDSSKVMLLVEDGQGQPFGYVQFNSVGVGCVCDWGFYLAPEAVRGSGWRMGKAALQYIFKDKSAHKVYGQVLGFNVASTRFHEKLGFQLEGRLREHHELNGKYHDVFCYGLMADEWNKVDVGEE